MSAVIIHPYVNVLVGCEYFKKGMCKVFAKTEIEFNFITKIDELIIPLDDNVTILLVLDISSISSLTTFKNAILFLEQINCNKKIGVLVSKYNAYLTYYVYKKLHGRVTFFNSHNLNTGLFERNFITWLKGRTHCPMRVVNRYKDNRYGINLKEWLVLVIPLSGESIREMSKVLKLPTESLYQIRNNALNKLHLRSYREFCDRYMQGRIRIENDVISRIDRLSRNSCNFKIQM